ncbi:ubiquinone biosynthesis accessory factor UbiJ [Psychromonas aquatilis]|uniref:Ubiquinone biosynthesis accessory factor UbiJ n=1 Tax=Psychromonas aquatilis TaxID=2005072 RepID=A0ABU9GL50_9GAMM
MPLVNLLCGLLETGVNQLHSLDSGAAVKRKQLNGVVVGVSLKEVNFPLYFAISEQQVDILHQFEGEPNCRIQVSLSALGKIQDNNELTNLIKTDQLEVEGDIQLVQQFAQLLTEMDIDWEEHLSHKVGDVIAHKLCYHAKSLSKESKNQFSKIEKQTALYLTEEIKLAPSALEVVYFCDQVSLLNEQTERLEQRIEKRLTNK